MQTERNMNKVKKAIIMIIIIIEIVFFKKEK